MAYKSEKKVVVPLINEGKVQLKPGNNSISHGTAHYSHVGALDLGLDVDIGS